MLLVEGQDEGRESLEELISSRCGCKTESVSTASGAVLKMGQGPFEVVVADLSLPDAEGQWLLEKIREQAPQTSVIAVSEDDSAATVLGAMRAGAKDFVAKPLDAEELVTRVRHLLGEDRLGRANQKWRRRTADHMRILRKRRRRLAEQVELVCRDLVGGYRRAVERLLELQMQQECRAAIEGKLEMKPLLNGILRYLSKTFKGASGVIFLWPRGEVRSRLFTPRGGGPPADIEDYDQALLEGIVQQSLSRQEAMLGRYNCVEQALVDGQEDESADEAERFVVRRAPRSLAATGLYVGEEVVGAVALQRKQENAFSQEECKLLGNLAGPIAKAVHVAGQLAKDPRHRAGG